MADPKIIKNEVVSIQPAPAGTMATYKNSDGTTYTVPVLFFSFHHRIIQGDEGHADIEIFPITTDNIKNQHTDENLNFTFFKEIIFPTSLGDTSMEDGETIEYPSFKEFDLEYMQPEGVIFFQYLVFHCKSVSVCRCTDGAIRKELGIKRTALDTLRKRFIDLGILDVEKDLNRNNIHGYRIKFDELAKPEKLRTIYRNLTPEHLAELSQEYKSLDKGQKKTPRFNNFV
jgi:hypothetical protein